MTTASSIDAPTAMRAVAAHDDRARGSPSRLRERRSARRLAHEPRIVVHGGDGAKYAPKPVTSRLGVRPSVDKASSVRRLEARDAPTSGRAR
jgi:hypothetical protein